MRIELTIPAIPVAQPRPRAVAFGGKARMHEVTSLKGADGSRRPHPIAAFKATVRMVAQERYSGPPLTGPLRVDCVFIFPRETSKIWKRKPMPRYRHTVKPDRDNCDKAVLDSLKGTVIADDSQVCVGTIEKWRAAGDEQPHVEIVIETLDEEESPAAAVLERLKSKTVF
jgi:Holliday junction resolvase RusA-like endonuclease